MSKQLFTTKTFWLNAGIVGVVAVLKFIMDMNPDPLMTVGIGALINWLNRLVTKEPSHL